MFVFSSIFSTFHHVSSDEDAACQRLLPLTVFVCALPSTLRVHGGALSRALLPLRAMSAQSEARGAHSLCRCYGASLRRRNRTAAKPPAALPRADGERRWPVFTRPLATQQAQSSPRRCGGRRSIPTWLLSARRRGARRAATMPQSDGHPLQRRCCAHVPGKTHGPAAALEHAWPMKRGQRAAARRGSLPRRKLQAPRLAAAPQRSGGSQERKRVALLRRC